MECTISGNTFTVKGSFDTFYEADDSMASDIIGVRSGPVKEVTVDVFNGSSFEFWAYYGHRGDLCWTHTGDLLAGLKKQLLDSDAEEVDLAIRTAIVEAMEYEIHMLERGKWISETHTQIMSMLR